MLFKRKDDQTEEEDARCADCIYARADGTAVYCRKKGKTRDGDSVCSSYEYDLTKRRPPEFPDLSQFTDDGKDALL